MCGVVPLPLCFLDFLLRLDNWKDTYTHIRTGHLYISESLSKQERERGSVVRHVPILLWYCMIWQSFLSADFLHPIGSLTCILLSHKLNIGKATLLVHTEHVFRVVSCDNLMLHTSMQHKTLIVY
jgi:hypothetical protein